MENKEYFKISFETPASCNALLTFMKSTKLILNNKVVMYFVGKGNCGFIVEVNVDANNTDFLFRNYEENRRQLNARLINLDFIVKSDKFKSYLRKSVIPLTFKESEKANLIPIEFRYEDNVHNQIFLKDIRSKTVNVYIGGGLGYSYTRESESVIDFTMLDNYKFNFIKKTNNKTDFINLCKLHLNY